VSGGRIGTVGLEQESRTLFKAWVVVGKVLLDWNKGAETIYGFGGGRIGTVGLEQGRLINRCEGCTVLVHKCRVLLVWIAGV